MARNDVTLEDVRELLPNLVNLLPEKPDDHILFFWSLVSSFRVEYPKVTESPIIELSRFSNLVPLVLDKNGAIVGKLSSIETINPAKHIDGYQEFVLVAERRLPGNQYPPEVIVLMITRDKDSIATRLDRAEIQMAAWEKSNPERTLIALE